MKSRMNCTRMIWRKGWILPIFKSSWCKIACVARYWVNSAPQTAATTFCFLFCINPSSMSQGEGSCWWPAVSAVLWRLLSWPAGGQAGHNLTPGVSSPGPGTGQTLYILYNKNQREGKAKIVAAGWGDGIECRTSSKDDLKKSFWKNIHFRRWWFGVQWTGW